MNKLLKRFLSYLIDLIFLGVIIMLISYFIPKASDTLQLQSKINNLNDAILSESITFPTYLSEYTSIIYQLDREKITFSVINFVIIFVYFIIVPFITNGKTLGNYIFGLRIKNYKNDNVSLLGLISRNLIINGLGYLIIQIVLVNLLDSKSYFLILTIFAFIQILLVIISVFMIKCRKDERGLHEILSGTTLISIK